MAYIFTPKFLYSLTFFIGQEYKSREMFLSSLKRIKSSLGREPINMSIFKYHFLLYFH